MAAATATTGMVSFITGAASGLGKGTLLHLLRNGARGVYCYDMQPFPVDSVNDKNKFMYRQGDVRDEQSTQDALEECFKKFGRIDNVINCAGVSVAFRIFNFRRDKPHSLKDFQQVIDINVTGTFNVVRLACPFIFKNDPNKDGQRGVIINTSATAGFDGQIGQAAYSASAGAINSMTLPLARDLGSSGIRVMTIAVGYFNTPLISYLPENIQEFLRLSTLCPRRLGEPEDYAKLVQAIIENAYLNGSIIRLDGGMRALV
ncbi:3-hydroxyacyl-CoA dehydrogenase type-2-like [Brevipalpus obovatus]|uniref:3-hydroxyacyl-CoA dehydrogenase type-2-like n=1 Tax=Brevipalpus obovatus TaxID=246614 RepID=UPI003D9E7F4A